ncbi:MAG: Rrf2 family transcriptional regulator, partial [Cellvibrionales bacterium]|nr:Rrf2 family transcriptional regulator [Cellvibrionales bacterium]
AFRVLIYLSSTQEDKSNIQAIADTYDLSKAHLMKVVNQLANKGWIESIRGKNGGIRLKVEPITLSIREIIEEMENTLAPVNCSEPMCLISPQCKLKSILFQAQEQWLISLERYTLADLILTPEAFYSNHSY